MKSILAPLCLFVAMAAPTLAADPPTSDIVDTAVASGSFKTLVAAVQAADLVDTLKSNGPFTVFAPTDAAFAKLPKGAVEALLKDPAKLRSVLTYHVVPGSVMAADVAQLKSAKTVLGQEVRIATSPGGVRIDSANVVSADIRCSNGVIHVIDAVLIPQNDSPAKEKDIVATAAAAGSFKTLAAALEAAGLVETLQGSGPFTVFAPTDEAFAKLPAGTVEALLKDKPRLQKVLKYHVVSGKLTSDQIGRYSAAHTLAGQTVRIDACQDVKINGSKVVKADVAASNGVIHVIDAVLLPN